MTGGNANMKLLIPLSARPGSWVLLFLLLVLSVHAPALLAQNPQQRAWDILRAGVNEKSTAKRVQAVRALRLLPGDSEATEMAQRALLDRRHEVRAAAATALGLMGSKVSIPELKRALADKDPSVVLTAAHALQVLNDPAGYEVYYELLTGERRSSSGLVAQEMETMRDPTKMAELGIEEGIGFIPFGGIGYSAAKAIAKDDTSPARAAAARILVNDPDPRISQALARAVSDKSWIVRASALLAIAKREDPEFLNAIVPAMSDKKAVVRYTAAAAVIRLTTVAERSKDAKRTSKGLARESKSWQTHSETPVTGMVSRNGPGEKATNQTK
jgi:HEAT repeat protein